ncbi:MAG: hypothetical protein LC744_03770 [Chloroflexi bacterium]|nr:hypothetical protein [Chloroflexota bacterium]
MNSIDECSRQLLLDRDADGVGRRNARRAAPERGVPDHIGLLRAARRAQQREDDRVVRARIGVSVDHLARG